MFSPHQPRCFQNRKRIAFSSTSRQVNIIIVACDVATGPTDNQAEKELPAEHKPDAQTRKTLTRAHCFGFLGLTFKVSQTG